MSRRSDLLAAASLLVIAAVLAPRALRKMPDFEVYWKAGRRIAAAEPLYRPEDGHFQLKYLPAFALLIAPVALAPLPAAKAVWFVLIVSGLVLLVSLSVRLAPRGRLPTGTLALLVTVAMIKFFLHELTLGQSNGLMACLILLSMLLLRSGRDGSAGLAAAAALIVKPYAVAFLPYLVVRNRWRALGTATTAVAVALAAPALIYGWQQNVALLFDWITTLSTSTAPNLTGQDNVSIWAMYAKWLGVGSFAFWLAAITVAALMLAFLRLVRHGRAIAGADYLDTSALLLLLPLCSPQGWDYVLLIATPAVALLISKRAELRPPLRTATMVALFVMAFSLFDLMGRQAYGRFMAMSTITLCALVMFAALASLRARSIA